ncbi:MAG: ribonuclease P protein component [Atopobiaceae bacterium]|nr:ribonuclease P protein component [Atopobiaceae bacterium]
METIKSKREFERVFKGGRRYSHPLVRATVLLGDSGDLGRVAFVAPKRLGNAVFRNRCKRVLREAARSCGLPVHNADVILFATRSTHGSNPKEVAAAMRKLMERAHVSCA